MPGPSGEPTAGGGTESPRRPGWRERTRVVVRDESMGPALVPGDRLLVDRGAYTGRPPHPGEIVVLTDPEEPSRWLIKRVAAVDDATGAVDVRGDARELARDSRRFGPVAATAIVGRAYRLYFPPSRRRDL
jgi:nickel-type superoxide dismutase maturation protease